MGLELHDKCGRLHYVPGPCPAPGVFKPSSANTGPVTIQGMNAKKLTVDGRSLEAGDLRPGQNIVVNLSTGEVVPAKDKRNGDRHKPGYQAQKQREYRARRAKMKEAK